MRNKKIIHQIMLIFCSLFLIFWGSSNKLSQKNIMPQALLAQKQNDILTNEQNLNNLPNPYLESPNLLNQTEIKPLLNDEIEQDSDFFKVYQTKEKLITNQENNLAQMGEIVALKISGLPLVSNSNFGLYNLIINELTIKDQNNEDTTFTIDYLRAINLNLPNIQPSFAEDNLIKVMDGNLNSSLEIKNVAAPQAIEINILLENPTILSNILMSINTEANSTWKKIGSIEFLAANGDVYRQNNLNLENHKIGLESGLNSYNFSLVNNDSAWSVFRASAEEKIDSLYMFSYQRDKMLIPNTIAYFGDLLPNRSITPILVSSTTVFIQENSSHEIINQQKLNGNPTQEQKLAFLKTIDDLTFWNILLKTINLEREPKENLTIESFEKFDNSFKNDNSKAWNLKIIFDGMGSTLDANSLQNLEFLGTLHEIESIKIASNIEIIQAFSYTLNIDQMGWIVNLDKLTYLSFQGDKGPTTTLPNNALIVYGQPANWDYLKVTALHYLDLTAFRPFVNIKTDYLIDQITASSWIASFSTGFTIYLPNTSISGYINWAVEEIFDVEEIKEEIEDQKSLLFDYLQLVKIIATPFDEPRLYIDEQGHYQTTILNVNGIEIPAKLLGGIWYWDFSVAPSINAKDIAYSDFSKQFYFTIDNPHEGFEENELIKLSIKDDYENLPVSNVDLVDPGKLNNNNSFLLDDFIIIDEQHYNAKIFNGNLFWDYDLTKIKYGYREKNNLRYHFFSSIDNLVALIGLENLKDFYVFEIPNNTNDDYRQMYYDTNMDNLKVKDVDLNSLENEIWVDGILFDDWVIRQGNIVWNFNQKIKIEDIKFMDNKGAYFTKALDENKKVIPQLTTIIEHDPYLIIPTKNPPLNDPGIIQDPDDINKTIFVDDEEVPAILRNGSLYWNYPIENIQYEAYDATREMVVYYTIFNKISKKIPFENITSISQAAQRNIPNNAIFPILNDTPGVIKIVSNDDEIKEYDSIFAYGKWYWNIPKEEIMKIHYKDNNNIFYHQLTPTNFAKSGMTEVFLPNIESLIVEIDQIETQFPLKLTSQNLHQINEGYTINGEHRDFIIIENKVYFNPLDWERVNYIYENGNAPYELYTTLDNLASEKVNFLFSKSLFNYEETTLNEAIIQAPKSLEDVLKIIDENGKVDIISVVGSANKFYYNNIEKLLNIKYVNKDGIYFTSLQSEYINSVFTSVDIFASNLGQLANKESEIYKEQLESRNLISKILVLSAGASVAIVIIVFITIRLATRNKRK